MEGTRTLVLGVLTATCLALTGTPAHAVPSFARQTNMPCSACHTGGFYPELNNFGRMFKLNGYVWSAHEDKEYETTPPFAAAQSWSYTRTDKAQPGLTRHDRLPTVAFATDGHDNFSFPQQANFFFAGRYYGRLGGFIMGTYSGADNKWAADNIDVRLSDVHTFGEKHTLLYGATLNNGPTVQDAWNTLPAWSQLIGSEVAPGPAASNSISNLIGQVAGVGAYALWDEYLYAEVTPYLSGKSGVLAPTTAGIPKDSVTDGVSPYWRLALYRNKDNQAFSVGYVGLYDRIYQQGASGPTNSFLDQGGDVQYQWSGKPHFVTLRGAFIWENQGLTTAKAAKTAGRGTSDVRTLQLWGSYYYNNLAGLTLSFFDIEGPRDRVLYAPAELDGSRTGLPNTWGGFVQLNLLPFARWFDMRFPALPMTQLALQYTFYGEFNGARHNYDGFGRRASDNNTLYLLAWTPW